uniref:CDP-diacylglycerol--glycerol-3-phosphate 3-phosphatidyltransferase n=3 Tax=Cafeteria roenbergensis TaxID=33653 RepID=A0A7S0PA49_CAFRO
MSVLARQQQSGVQPLSRRWAGGGSRWWQQRPRGEPPSVVPPEALTHLRDCLVSSWTQPQEPGGSTRWFSSSQSLLARAVRKQRRSASAAAPAPKDEGEEQDLMRMPGADMPEELARRETVFGTIPNIMTVARLASTAPLCYLVATGHMTAACGLFMVSGALDFADGAIARRFPSQASVLGSFLDPFADKVLIAGTTVALTASGYLSPWVTGVILSRDAGLIGAGFIYRALTRAPGSAFFSTTTSDSFQVTPSRLSKANMAAQVGLVALALGSGAGLVDAVTAPGVGSVAVDAVSVLVAGTTLASWYGYARTPAFARFVRLLRERMAGK